MPTQEGLIKQLEKNRDDYDKEAVWMRFLIDAFTGAGGFQGRVKQAPSGYWGAAAETYATVAQLLTQGTAKEAADSYLDRHRREDGTKFQSRIDRSYYLNYVKPTTLLKVSYFMRKMHMRKNVPPRLQDWMKTTGYDDQMRRRAITTAVLGWMPVLVDMPPAVAGKHSEPYVRDLLPCHLVDFELNADGDALAWAKLMTPYWERSRWDAPRSRVKRYTIWDRASYEYHEVVETESGATRSQEVRASASGSHVFGRMPIAMWRADISIEDPIKAESWNADIAPVSRRLFNLLSELDEVLRGSAFPLLVLPLAQPTPGASLEVGVENALLVDPEQKNLPFFAESSGAASDSLEKRITSTIIEIYRMSRVEYERASGVASSAQSKAQNFAQTNLAIVDFAAAIAAADRDTLTLVSKGLGIADSAIDKIECIPESDFAEDDLQVDIDEVISTLTIRQLGSRFQSEVLKRFARRVLPHMETDSQKVVDGEIDELAKAVAQDDDALRDDAAPFEPKDDDAPDAEAAQ